MPARSRTHYELLGVAPDCTFDELRSAYRRLARQHHPDVAATAGQWSMAEVNEAWRVLSDERLRRIYDRSVLVPQPPSWSSPTGGPRGGFARQDPGRRGGVGTAPPQTGSRRQAWAAGVAAQMARLSRQAGRSATQTLLIKVPRGSRADYEAIVDELVVKLSRDAESRVRAARAAGTAPLDLGVAATLVGIRSVADSMRRDAPLGVSTQQLMAAELLDRMWDVLAHELPVQLTSSLGGNPHLAQALARHL